MKTVEQPSPLSPDRNRALAWLMGTAAGAAATAQAALVEIDLVGNKATFNGNGIVDNTDADLTGDGIDDLTGTQAMTFTEAKGAIGITGQLAGVDLAALYNNATEAFYATVGYRGASADSPRDVTGFVFISFTDSRINGGAQTRALVQVRARNVSDTVHEIQLLRLIFDDESPEFPRIEFPQDEAFPDWVDPSLTSTGGNNAAAKSKLKRKIAALEAKIRRLKATGRTNPRLPFYANRNLQRQLALLERKLASLKLALSNL